MDFTHKSPPVLLFYHPRKLDVNRPPISEKGSQQNQGGKGANLNTRLKSTVQVMASMQMPRCREALLCTSSDSTPAGRKGFREGQGATPAEAAWTWMRVKTPPGSTRSRAGLRLHRFLPGCRRTRSLGNGISARVEMWCPRTKNPRLGVLSAARSVYFPTKGASSLNLHFLNCFW